jgi:phosphoenolpyruvate---glycerone phosphotransferase subunit DhaM
LSKGVRHCRIGLVLDGASRDGSVGLVLVSHSERIAAGLAELVEQVAGPEVTIVPVGGGPDGSLGTDGDKVFEALRESARGAGAVVLMDIGSSVLAVRAALSELSDAERARLEVVDAPLVEGALAAGVAASIGGSAAEVAEAAREARLAAKL